MKTIDPQISPEEDLSEILSKCLLVPRYGSRKFGNRFAIEISGRNPLRAKFGNLRLRIIPLVPLISGDPALLDVAKRGQQELTDDLNPGIATRARSELDRLSSPPIPAEVLQHRRIHLNQVGTSGQTVETDANGEATFTDVELDRECSFSLELAKAGPAMATGTTESGDRNNPAIDRTLALAAKSGPAGIITCRTGDTRVRIWIEAGSHPCLKAQAGDPSLATAELRFRLGNKDCHFRLEGGKKIISIDADDVPDTASISLDGLEIRP